MSKYTTQLRWIVEQLGSGIDVPEGQEYPDAVYKYIGLDKYPIFDETYRPKLNDKIIDHFFFREIGFETAGQFAFYLRRTMNEIMPKYNALYRAQLTMDTEHPLSDFTNHKNENWESHTDDDYERSQDVATNETDDKSLVGTSTNTTTDTVNGTSTNHNRNVFQDTPMSLLSNDGSPSVEGLDYATNVTYDDGNGSNSSTANGSATGRNTEDTNREINRDVDLDESKARDIDTSGERLHDEYGNRRSWAALMEEYADKWINIDMMVIGDLEDLFMGLW